MFLPSIVTGFGPMKCHSVRLRRGADLMGSIKALCAEKHIGAGVVLSAIGLYQPLVDLAGAGATVPLSGFGHLMATGVRDAVDRDGAIGILTGALTAAAGGISAAVVFSLFAGLFSKPKEK